MLPPALVRVVQGWFVFWSLLLTAIGLIPSLMLLGPFEVWTGAAKRCVNAVAGRAMGLHWRLALFLCPWISVRREGWGDWRKLGASGRPVVVVSNHVSWVDVMLFVAYCPAIGRFRALCAASLWKIPLLGTLCRSCGHVKVHFSDHRVDGSSSSLAVDHAKAGEMDRHLRAIIEGGSGVAFYPEGQLNKQDPRRLQPFRYGGFRYLVEFDMEVWAMLHVGHDETWPLHAAVGGLPARIHQSLICVAPEGALKLIGRDAASQDIDADSRLLAEKVREIMQVELDRLWCKKDGDGGGGGYRRLNGGA